jgi:hypothetical protein
MLSINSRTIFNGHVCFESSALTWPTNTFAAGVSEAVTCAFMSQSVPHLAAAAAAASASNWREQQHCQPLHDHAIAPAQLARC